MPALRHNSSISSRRSRASFSPKSRWTSRAGACRVFVVVSAFERSSVSTARKISSAFCGRDSMASARVRSTSIPRADGMMWANSMQPGAPRTFASIETTKSSRSFAKSVISSIVRRAPASPGDDASRLVTTKRIPRKRLRPARLRPISGR